MSDEDRARWDHKWGEMDDEDFSPHPLLVKHRDLLQGGVALDIACGLGQNAIWLTRHRYKVLAIDISGVGLAKAMSQAEDAGVAGHLQFAQMDLTNWSLADAVFDLICVFRYLERNLFSGIRRGLKKGGLLIYATRHVGILKTQPRANKKFLLRPGELMEAFGHWQVIHYQEGIENAQIIARKQ